jgi:hypothetical protein
MDGATVPGMRRLALLVAVGVSIAPVASAQPAPAASRLETVLLPGRTVWITTATAPETRMRIVDMSGAAVTALAGDERRRLAATDITRVRVRRSDSVIDGALIGAGVAVGSGLFFCTRLEPWENCRDDVGPMLRIGALGAAVGIGVDALIRGRHTIYEASSPGATRLRATPILAGSGGGLQVSISF